MYSNGTVLVVDDNESIKELLRNFLVERGYTVVTAADATSGLSKLKLFNFDLVISDIMMPGISGIDMLMEIHKLDPDLPIVMITGYPTIDTAVKVIKEGATDFITKPFNLDHAKFVVSKAIEGGRLKRQNRTLTEQMKEVDKIKEISRHLQDKVSELSALYTISDVFHHTFTTSEVMDKAVDVAMSVCEARKAALWIYDRETSSVILRNQKGFDGLPVGASLQAADSGLIGKAFADRTHVVERDYRECRCGEAGNGQKHPFLGEPFAGLQICQKVGGADFSRNDVSIMTDLARKIALRLENLALYENLTENMFKSVMSLITAIDARDNYTMHHCTRVTDYAVRLATAVGAPSELVDAIKFAGPIHDVGKIGVRDGILLKPGRLDSDERSIMQSHVVIGDGIIKHLNLGHYERAVVRNHHEQFDGSGYPDGLKHDAIPLVARIFSVADTFDAMTSNRPYRTARSVEDTVAELLRCSGTQFDGELVQEFIKLDICSVNTKPV
jgi:response regulator RpfG family c-di-GMP phosphodiesterase